MMLTLISRAHDWRYTGDGWEWSGSSGTWADLKRRGYQQRQCMDCGLTEQFGHFTRKPCRRKGEHINSGFGGVIIDQTGAYRGRINMRGRHPVTGKPFVQRVGSE